MTRGVRRPAPKGFADSIEVNGRRFAIKYYSSLRMKGKAYDGQLSFNKQEIWVAVHGRSLDRIRDCILHEALHAAIDPHRVSHLDVDTALGKHEEAIVCHFEGCISSVLCQNQWFTGLFKEDAP